MSGFFVDLNAGLRTSDIPEDAGEIREFTGDGSQVLPVPGCKQVNYVRVGRQTVIPPTWEHEYPINNRQTTKEIHPSYVLSEQDGKAVLLRSLHSNFGHWQQGETIYVGGVWDEAAVETQPEPEAAAVDPLAELTGK